MAGSKEKQEIRDKTVSQYEVASFIRFGREVKITPKANAIVRKPGAELTFHGESVEVLVGIGKNHTAFLVMDIEAWEALQAGEPVTITTTKEFERKYEKRGKK